MEGPPLAPSLHSPVQMRLGLWAPVPGFFLQSSQDCKAWGQCQAGGRRSGATVLGSPISLGQRSGGVEEAAGRRA